MKLIPITEIFDIRYGNQFDLSKMDILSDDIEGINFVSRSAEKNGISWIVEKFNGIEPFSAWLITVAMGGSVLASFVQPKSFYTGQNIKVLTPKFYISEQEKIYYCAAIEENKFRYGTCGREANSTFDTLLIPSPEEIPESVKLYNLDDKFIEKPLSNKKFLLDTKNWKSFRYDEVFDIKKWKRLTIPDMIDGEYPYIASGSTNNWVVAYVDDYTNNAGSITYACYGSIGEVFYHEKSIWASDNVNILKIKNYTTNKYIWLFLTSLLDKEKYRFSYGLTAKMERLKNMKIKLPITSAWTPDWQWMEKYIKSLPYSANL